MLLDDGLKEAAPRSSAGGDSLMGLVLSGGGMRGAYEVGIMAGLLEALSKSGHPSLPFQLAAGASVGAINASFVAANAHAPGLNLDRLIGAWTGMDFSTVFMPQLLSFFRQLFRGTVPPVRDQHLGVSLLNPAPLEALVKGTVDFDALHANIERRTLGGLFIAALQVGTGKTIIFCELGGSTVYRQSKDPRRAVALEPITLDHVLASTAIPLIFPARRVGNEFYCDGGLRLNTPIAPVIRAGAERLVIVSTTYVDRASSPPLDVESLATYPSLAFLTGKVLNALLVDPLAYDLQILSRINDLVDVHQRGLSQHARDELKQRMMRRRGATYRHIETLVFVPSQDIGRLASKYLKDNIKRFDVGLLARRLLRSAAEEGNADWATYLLFDGGFAEQVIELGRRDALRRRDEIRAFCHA